MSLFGLKKRCGVSLVWIIKWKESAKKQLKKLDRSVQKKILDYLDEKTIENPYVFGKELTGDKSGLWRYRVGDYRIVCRVENDCLTVLVLAVGHRKEIY